MREILGQYVSDWSNHTAVMVVSGLLVLGVLLAVRL